MPDVVHNLPITALPEAVFAAVSNPAGLDQWWTLNSEGTAQLGTAYHLGFGPGYEWKGIVTRCDPGREFELEITEAEVDWVGTRVGFALMPTDSGTHLEFHHSGWSSDSSHYRTSCYCWAMYLRIMKRYVELGETVAYDKRLDV